MHGKAWRNSHCGISWAACMTACGCVCVQEALSFADAVRAFRRKRIIEALMAGGTDRLKVVAFHDK